MVCKAEPCLEYSCHCLLWGLCLFAQFDGCSRSSSKHRVEGCKRRTVITKKTFKPRKRHRGKECKVPECHADLLGSFSLRAHRNKPVKVKENSFHCPSITILTQSFKTLCYMRGGLFPSISTLSNMGICSSSELTEPLELVNKLVQNVECPLGQDEEPISVLPITFSVCLGKNKVEEVAVNVPTINPILHLGAGDAVQVTVCQLTVKGKEKRITTTLIRYCFWRWPRSSGEVLRGELAESPVVKWNLLSGQHRPAGRIVQVKDEVLEGAGQAGIWIGAHFSLVRLLLAL
mmetsp:Transcript_40788/g.122882  ORF Transcript_40788/g.122882 Transcript_40788/m.122882 type:complete len:289 (+) Transcript_40788:902-1768(+)